MVKLLTVLSATLAVVFLLQVYFTSSANQKLEDLQKDYDKLLYVKDSIYAENYPCQIELNRFRIAYEIFSERNPKAADQYGDIISNETE